MTQALGFILVIMALVIHEAGHIIAMTRRRVEIAEAGIFFPVKKAKLTFHPKWLPYPLVVGIIPLGAYVKPTARGERQLEEMSYKDQAICYSAGVITNIVFGCILIAGSYAYTPLMQGGPGLTTVWIYLGVAVIATMFRRLISVVMPILGIASVVLITWSLIQSTDSVGGPVAIVGTVAAVSTSWLDAVWISGAVSLSIGQINTVPLYPTDGGRVMYALFVKWGWKRLGDVFKVVTGLTTLVLIVTVIVHDLV